MIGILTVPEEEQPLIQELWGYFYDTYFNPSEYYENLNMSSSALFSLRMIILGLCIGLGLAAFGAVFNKRVLGGIVRRILSKEAFSQETALTLEELGYSNNLLAHWAVRKSTSLRRVVKCRQEQEFESEQAVKRREYEQKRADNKKLPRFKELGYKMDTYSDAFYIPEEMRYMADIKFEKKGTTLRGAILFTVILFVVFIAIIVALPQILSLIDSFVGSFGSPSNGNIL